MHSSVLVAVCGSVLLVAALLACGATPPSLVVDASVSRRWCEQLASSSMCIYHVYVLQLEVDVGWRV